MVKGALSSLLGPDYLLHPHRAVHTSTPLNKEDHQEWSSTSPAPTMGKGSMAGSAWHQDAQSPLARARYHMPRHLIAFYFPHDTPRRMGPTRIQAGSYLHARPSNENYMILPEFIPAGTVILLHFDMVHAGFSNLSDETRYMFKFVFSRTSKPDKPDWNNQSPTWNRPAACLVEEPLDAVWSDIWFWMQGREPARAASIDLEHHLDDMDSENPSTRLNSIFCLGRSPSAIPALLDLLLSVKGLGREKRNLIRNKRDEEIPVDSITREPRWNERAIVMENATYALSLAGNDAVAGLIALSEVDDAWIALNACFALGEISAPEAIEPLTQLLDNPYQQVVRQALDALGNVTHEINRALASIARLLQQSNPNWQAREVMRGWNAENQVRLNAAFTLVNAISRKNSDLLTIERLLIQALNDPNGYVPEVACEGLLRIGSKSALLGSIQHLKRHRWDSSLIGGRKIF